MSKVTFRNILDTESEFKEINVESNLLIPLVYSYAKTMDNEIYNIIMTEKISLYVNGEMIALDDWHLIEIEENDEVIIVPNVEGGALKIAIGAVLMVASAWIPGLNVYVAQFLFAAGASLTLGGISELLFRPDLPVISDTGSKTTQTYNWSGIKTTARTDQPVPLVYGTHMVGGNVISIFTESLAEENYLYMLIALCEGEIDGICQEYDHTSVCTTSLSTDDGYANPAIKLDDQPLKSYNDVEWWFRNGTNTQTKIPNFDGARTQMDDGRQILYGVGVDGEGIVYTTTKPVDRVNVQVRAPALYDATGAKVTDHEIKYKVYWKNVSDETYTLWEPDAYTPIASVCTTANRPSDLLPISGRTTLTISSFIKDIDYKSTNSEIIYSIKRPTIIIHITGKAVTTHFSFSMDGGSNTFKVSSYSYIIYEVTDDGIDKYESGPLPDTNIDYGFIPSFWGFTNLLVFYDGINWIALERGDYRFSISHNINVDDVFMISSEIDPAGSSEIIVKGKSKTGYWSSVVIPLSDDDLGNAREIYMLKIQRSDNPSSDDFLIADDMVLNSVTEIVDGDFTYPNTALLGFKLRATEQLSGAPPNVTTILRGLKVTVPDLKTTATDTANFSFDRAYWDEDNEKWYDGDNNEVFWNDESSWRTEFTDNSILCVNNLMTNTRYGIGDFVTTDDIYTTSLKSVMKDCHASYSLYNATFDYTGWWTDYNATEWRSNLLFNVSSTDTTASYNATNRQIEFTNSDLDGEVRFISMVVKLNSPLTRGSSYTFSIEFGEITETIKSIRILAKNYDTNSQVIVGNIENKTIASTYTTTIAPKFSGSSELILEITSSSNIDFRIDDISVSLTTTDHFHTWDGVLDGKQAAPTAIKEMCDSFRTYISWYNGRFNFIMDKDTTPEQTISRGNTVEFSQAFTPLSEIPYRLIGQYTDEEFNFDMKQIVARSSDSTLNKSNERTIGLKGITNRMRAVRELKYKSRYVTTNVQSIMVKCGQDMLHKTAGDLINISDSLPSWGHGGRIIDFNSASNKITIDDPYNFTSTDSGATVHLINYTSTQNNTVTASLYITATGSQQELIVKNWVGSPADYAVFALGDETTYVKPFRLIYVGRTEDSNIEFTGIEHNTSVYVEDGQITVGNTNHSTLPNQLSEPKVPSLSVAIADPTLGVGFEIKAVPSSGDNVTKEIIIEYNELEEDGTDDYSYTVIGKISLGSNNTLIYIDNSLKLDNLYSIKAYARSTYKLSSPTYVRVYIDDEIYKPVSPSGVYIKGANPNDVDDNSRHKYDGKDVNLSWNPVGVQYNNSLTIKGYVVDVYKEDSSGNLTHLRTENVANTNYDYTYGKNLEDSYRVTLSNVPNNNLTFKLRTENMLAVSETPTVFKTVNVVPSTPTGLTSTAIEDGVTFNWNPNTEVDVVKYTYRLQVESGGWSDWQETFGSYVTRKLTTAELVAQAGGRSNIQIEVKAIDVYGQESDSAATANADCKNERIAFTVSPTLNVGNFQYIQDAINQVPDGSQIFLKEGTYDLSNEVLVASYNDGVCFKNKNITLEGASTDGVKVLNNPGDNCFNIDDRSKQYYMTNFSIYSQNTATESEMIYSNNLSGNLDIDNLKIVGNAPSDKGINIAGNTGNININNSYIATCDTCFQSGTSDNINITSNILKGDTPIGINEGNNLSVNNNTIEFRYFGIFAWTFGGNPLHEVIITNNIFKNDSYVDDSISIGGCIIMADNVNISNNSIYMDNTATNISEMGIYVITSDKSTISNNIIDMSASTISAENYGIYSNSMSNSVVSGNSLTMDFPDNDVNNWGIYEYADSNNNINSNTINMVNANVTDMCIYLSLTTSNNNITNNSFSNFGNTIVNFGSGNTFSENVENGVAKTENSGVVYDESLSY